MKLKFFHKKMHKENSFLCIPIGCFFRFYDNPKDEYPHIKLADNRFYSLADMKEYMYNLTRFYGTAVEQAPEGTVIEITL